LDARATTFEGLKVLKNQAAEVQGVRITIGQGAQSLAINIGEISVGADFIEGLLTKALEKFEPHAPITMTFQRASFNTGHDLEEFATKFGITLTASEVDQ
jgi:hypothetical protein